MKYLPSMLRSRGYMMSDRPVPPEPKAYGDFIPVAQFLREMRLHCSMETLAVFHVGQSKRTGHSLDQLVTALAPLLQKAA